MTRMNFGLATIAFAILFLAAAQAADAQADAQRIRWRFEIPSNVSGKFIGVGADDRVYTTSFIPEDLYALTPDGSLLWRLPGVGGSGPIDFGPDGTIYTGMISVFAIDADGSVRWRFTPPSPFWLLSGPSVGPDGNVYAAEDTDSSGRGLGVFSLDPSGTLRWSDRGEPRLFGLTHGIDDIVFGDNRLFSGIMFPRSGGWHTTYAFDLAGNQLWFGVGPRFLEATSSPRLLRDGRLIFRAGQGSLMAVRQDGVVDWIAPHPDGAQVLLAPVVGPDGSIYAGDTFGIQLWSANPDGTTRWVHGNTDEHLSSLGVSPDNRVLVASGTGINGSPGWIRGHDPANGDLLWELLLEPEQDLAQISRSIRPAFSLNGDTAYITTWFVGDGVGHSYLYAVNLGPGDPCGESPTIASHPASLALCTGSAAAFHVTATGAAPLSYVWRKNGLRIPNDDRISGADTSDLAIDAVIPQDGGEYDCFVTNACGAATSDRAALSVDGPPVITSQPQSQTVCEDDPLLLSVSVQSISPVTYRWRKNGSDVPGATLDTMSIPASSTEDAGDWDVVVTNDCDTTASDIAIIEIVALHLCARRGNVNSAADQITDVLFVNGSAGMTFRRSVFIGIGQAISLEMRLPPSKPSGTARFAVYLWDREPDPTTPRQLPSGIGTIAMPLCGGGADSPRRIWNNLGSESVLCAPTHPSAPAPSTFFRRPRGFSRDVAFYVQGVIRDAASPNGQAAVTNGVLVQVH